VKPGIHPTWYPDAVVTCACGNTWSTGSTKKEIHTDVCSACHPFFTGEQRIVDTAGQVERFMKRISAKEQIAASQPAPEEKKAKKEKRRERRTGTEAETPARQAPTELPLAEMAPVANVEAAPAGESSDNAPSGQASDEQGQAPSGRKSGSRKPKASTPENPPEG
jgi:large subunit ribosomal protein L31